MSRTCLLRALALLALFSLPLASGAQPLVTLEHHVVGARLRASPEQLFVPKDIPGSLAVDVVTAEGASRAEVARIAHGAHVEGTLRGPAFPAYRLLGLPNEPLLLPPIALAGEYQIDDLRLVNTESGEVLMMGSPSRISVHVFPEVLVSRVESRPLTLDEIQQRGIVIDADSFSAVEFQAAFVIDGATVPVRFPVISPKFKQSTQIIPLAEFQDRLVQAERMNRELSSAIALPRELDIPGLHIQIQGLNFQAVAGGDGEESELRVPPIPGLIVIPGHVGFLDQFFSVQVFTANAAPEGSNISVHDLSAEITLPTGPDRVASTPDDPLVLARIGPDAQTFSRVTIAHRLSPGQTGQGELVLEGKKEGLHVFDIALDGVLDGFAHGEVPIHGHAAGSVLVRNPKFSIAFSHPATIHFGEPYVASMTVMNTSETPAEMVTVNLHQASLSGATFASGQEETVLLGSIPAGESRTASYNLIAQRTGAVTFTNLTGDVGLSGRFDLTMGVDERGVALNANAIGYPDWVRAVPESVQRAVDRVLGQALSVSTAGILPPGVRKIAPDVVRARVLELAEAGQRVRYGDAPASVYLDLLLDFDGGRTPSAGFSQIMRATGAGEELGAAIVAELESAGAMPGLSYVTDRAGGVASRHEAWGIAATDRSSVEIAVDEERAYRGTSSGSFVLAPSSSSEIVFRVPAGSVVAQASWFVFDGAGVGTHATFAIESNSVEPVCYHYFPLESPDSAAIDLGCQARSNSAVAVTRTGLTEEEPSVISVRQDFEPLVLRPEPPCGGPRFLRFGQAIEWGNYGTVVAVLFSKPMQSDLVERPDAFHLDSGVGTNGVKIQPGGRVALVNLKSGIGDLFPRRLIASGIVDQRGHPLATTSFEILSLAHEGASISGRVTGVDGAPAVGVPVTLIMNDSRGTTDGCVRVDVHTSQVRSDASGRFHFDFIPAGIIAGYTLAATDTRNLDPAAIDLLLEASPNGPLDPDELARIATEPGALAAFMAIFNASNVHDAIAIADGVDRATFHDLISDARIGSDVPVALRFRGRGTVEGVVLESDRVTPVAGAAVNLFPDPTSRELGRGVHSSASGAFAFSGVPLGSFTIEASTGDGRSRVIAGRLAHPGDRAEVEVVLSAAVVPTGLVAGRVFEADATTPHAGARVAIVEASAQAVLAMVDSDEDGFFRTGPVRAGGFALLAISSDGKRSGLRAGLSIQADTTTYANIVLQGVAEVEGRVEFSNGVPAIGALVAGGSQIVTTGAGGAFHLTGVPVGRWAISAGLERNPSAGINFTRLGDAAIDVLPGVNYAVIRLRPAGAIAGEVLDAAGNPVSNVRVALPVDGGFYWTDADSGGNFRFDNLPLGDYTIAAPAPPVFDAEGAVIAVANASSEDELRAAIGDAYQTFVSGVPIEDYNPGSYGYARARLEVDGDLVTQNVLYLPEGTVSGTVLNELSIPIAARVSLLGLKPKQNGGPGFGELGQQTSDAASGAFFFGGLKVGRYTLGAVSPFYPGAIASSGETTLVAPSVSNAILQFGAQPTRGNMTGTVLSDGVPVGAGVHVAIDLAPGYGVMTDANGRFVSNDLLARVYSVDVLDEASGRTAFALVRVDVGRTTDVTLSLLTDNSTLDVLILQANGSPATGAQVTIDRPGRPSRHYVATSNASGHATIGGLIEGTHYLHACFAPAQTQLCGAASVEIAPGSNQSSTITLQGAGTVRGHYFEADGTTPVESVQVAIGTVAFAVTDALGAFAADGVPVGRHVITGRNPVTGRAATAVAQLIAADQIVDVTLREDALGEVAGHVIASDGMSPVPAATVVLGSANTLFPLVSVTTDPAGRFDFPGVPPGTFSLLASESISHGAGNATGEMPSAVQLVEVDVPFAARANLTITVLDPNGAFADATVSTQVAGTLDTNANGEVRFVGLPLGNLFVTARSRNIAQSHSTAVQTISLSSAGDAPPATVHLRGVGSLVAHLVDAQGANVANAQLTLEMQDQISGPVTDTAFTGSDGRHTFTNVALGDVRVRATVGGLGGSASGTLSSVGQQLTLELQLGPSATVHGTFVRADGVTPVINNELVIRYPSQSGLAGAATTRTDAAGHFSFSSIPVGTVTLEAVVPRYDGVLHASRTIVAGDADLGNVALDEEPPLVFDTVPEAGASGVSVSASIQIIFSEEMETHPDFTDPDALYLTDGMTHVPSALSWSPDGTTLFIDPLFDLASLSTYSVVVAAGEVLGPTGSLGFGPADLAHRPLSAALVFSFTTVDSIPPAIVSFTPGAGDEQVAIESVVRISFSEAMEPSSFAFSLVGPSGPVPGTLDIGLNRLIAVFTPSTFLAPNASYSATLSAATDLAGNAVVGLPIMHGFATIDTVGPVITDLVPSMPLISGSVVSFTAVLESFEPNVQVELTPDLSTFQRSVPGQLSIPFALGGAGSLHLFARGIDRFGNVGAYFDRVFTVQPNGVPAVSIAQLLPSPSGPLVSGQPYRFRIDAVDDGAIVSVDADASGASIATAHGVTTSLILNGLVPSSAGAGQSVTINAHAVDNSGEVGYAVPRTVSVIDGVSPVLQVVAGPSTTIDNGATATFSVLATDAFGVTELRFIATGAVTADETIPTSPSSTSVAHDFQLAVPASIPGGASIQVELRASDGIVGHLSSQTRFLTVQDVVRPSVVGTLPVDLAVDVPVQSTVRVFFSEPVTGVVTSSLRLEHNGVPVACDLFHAPNDDFAELTPLAPLGFAATYDVVATNDIEDLAGNLLVPFQSTFATPSGSTAARLTSMDPVDGATHVRPNPISFVFDAELNLSTITAATVLLEPAAGGPAIATTRTYLPPDVELDRMGHAYVFTPAALSLFPNTAYRVHFFGGDPLDLAGNHIIDATGHPIGELIIQFTTANVSISVSGPNRVVETSNARADLVTDASSPIRATQWRVDGVPTNPPGGSTFHTFAVPSLASRPSGTMVVGADAGLFAIADVTLTIEPANQDFDGDGLTNLVEANGGSDPWVADSDVDDDGLTNTQELVAGTNPFDPDTDDDGLLDGVDPDPLVATRPLAVGITSAQDQYLSTGTLNLPATTRIQPPLTFERWVFASSSGISTVLTTNDQALRIEYDGGNHHFRFNLNTVGSGAITAVAPQNSANNQWHHVALAYDGVRLRGYVDGFVAADVLHSGNLAYGSGTTQAFFSPEEVRLWNVARSATEITGSMHRVAHGTETGLFAQWRLDDGLGSTTALDSTPSHANNGTFASSPAPTWSPVSAPLFRDALVLPHSGEAIQLRAFDWDNHPLTLAVTQLGAHGRLFESTSITGFFTYVILGNAIVSVPRTYSTTTVNATYVADPSYSGSDQIALSVGDGTRTVPVTVEISTPVLRRWLGTDATAPTDWARAANWAPAGVPGVANAVSIATSTAPQPLVSSGAYQIASLAIGPGSSLQVAPGATVSVNGHLLNDGSVIGAINAGGVGSSLHGAFGPLSIAGLYSGLVALDGNVTSANFTIGSAFEVGPRTLVVNGALTETLFIIDQGLRMRDAQSIVDVNGNATFSCGGTNTFTAGTLQVSGNFSANCFAADAAHRTVFDGTAPPTQTVSFITFATNNFGTLEIASGAHASLSSDVIVGGDVFVSGIFDVPSGRTLRIRGDLNIAAGGTFNHPGTVTCHYVSAAQPGVVCP